MISMVFEIQIRVSAEQLDIWTINIKHVSVN